MWKYLYSDYAMIFEVPLVCCECIETLVLTRIYPNHLETISCSYYLTGSNYTFYIYPRALEMSVKSSMCVPGPNFWMVRYMDVADANNYSRLSVNMP